MKIAPIAEIKARLSEYIRQSSKEPVIITKNGRPTAILAGITDEDDLESLVLAYNPKFRRLLLEAEKRVREEQGIKHESLWKTVERKG